MSFLSPIILSIFYSLTYSQWISHLDNTMPRTDTMCAIGSYNDHIFVLGGLNKKRQITNYNIESDTFVFYQSSFIPINNKIFGEAQYYTQIGHNLYILDDLNSQNNNIYIMLYNMANNSFIADFDSIPVTISDGMGRSCITSSSIYNKIYLNGGINSNVAIKETYILDIITMQWSVIKQMQIARRSHSCICNNKNLYSIGGYSINTLTATIEKMSINNYNIRTQKWIYLNGSLSDPIIGLRSFMYDNNIIVIGGINVRKLYDTVHIIDTKTDTVSVSDIKLAFPTAYTAAIMVNHIMYAFGGGLGIDNWQSQTMLTHVTTTSDPFVAPNIDSTLPQYDYDNFLTTYGNEFGKIDELVIGNKVGIGLAIALFICLIIVIIFFFVHGGKIQKKRKTENFDKIYDNEQNEYMVNNSGDDDDDDYIDMNGSMNSKENDNNEKFDIVLVENKIVDDDENEQ